MSLPRGVHTNHPILLDIYENRIQTHMEYRGAAKPNLDPGTPSSLYSFLTKLKAYALPATDSVGVHAMLAAWIGLWDSICMQTIGHVCPKPGCIGITGRDVLCKSFGVDKLEYRSDRSCGSEFCPLCCLRRIIELDRFAAEGKHLNSLYSYYRKSYGTFVSLDPVDTLDYAVSLDGIAKKIEPVYAMKRIENIGQDLWDKVDVVWVKKYANNKDRKPLFKKFCGYLPTDETKYVNAKYAMYEGVLPDPSLVAAMVSWSGTPEHNWAMEIAKAHNTRRAFRTYGETKC